MRTPGFWIRLWDLLIWLLIIFPAVTGGVWIKRPGLFIELSELSVPVLIITALTAFPYLWLRAHHAQEFSCRLKQTSSMRLLNYLWQAWNRAVFNTPRRALWSLAIGVGGIWALASLRRHWAFGSGAADLGIFTNAIWNLTHGQGYLSSLKDGINLFQDHQSPLFWLLAPIFRLFPYPETLLIVQAFGLACGGVALHALARQYLPQPHWGEAALPLLYFAYAPLRNANAFDFHPEVFMLPLFLWGIVGLQAEDWKSRAQGILGFLLALGAKESAGPVAVGIGLAWVFGAAPVQSRPFTRRVGRWLIFIGMGVFLLDTQIVPRLFSGTYAYQAQYAQFGTNITDLLLAPFLKPTLFLQHLFGASRLKFYFWLLAPLAFLPLLNGRALVSSLPGFLLLALSTGDHRVRLIYHYAIEPSVGLFWALPAALLWIEKRSIKKGERFYLRVTPLWTLFWCLLAFGRSDLYRIRYQEPTAHQHWLSQEVIPCLSKGSLAAPGALVPHVSDRIWINHLPKLWLSDGRGVDCVWVDSAINNWPMNTRETKELLNLLEKEGYQKLYQCASTQLFKKQGADSSCLRCKPRCLDALF